MRVECAVHEPWLEECQLQGQCWFLFLATVTGSTDFITKNWILKKDITKCSLLLLLLYWVLSYLERWNSLQRKQSVTIWIKQIRWQIKTLETSKRKETNNPYAERENILKEKRGFLSPHMSVFWCLAYRLHTHQCVQSRKPNVHILGHVIAVKHLDPLN